MKWTMRNAWFLVGSSVFFACTNGARLTTVSDGGIRGPVDSGSRQRGDSGASVTCILVYSRTVGYRHESIPDGIAAIVALGREQGWFVRTTEDPSTFTDSELAKHAVVVFLSTTGDVLGPDEQEAFERFIRQGGGWVGIHAASDTEYDWPFYGGLVGAYFREHPAVQEAVVHVENAAHPATLPLPAEWRRTDEWYAFKGNPRPNVNVLLTLDEGTYEPGAASMDGDHPVAWYHSYQGGRAFYTALGHTRASFSELGFLAHIAGAIDWAAGDLSGVHRVPSACERADSGVARAQPDASGLTVSSRTPVERRF